MRYITPLVLLCLFPLAAFAGEEVAQEIPVWATTITAAIVAIIGWAFKLWRSRMKVDTEQHQLDATKSLMEQRNFIIDRRIIPFMESTATYWLTLRLPLILTEASRKDFDWTSHYYHLREYLKDRVVDKFTEENIDILKVLGEKELYNLIDRMLVKLLSKLPDSVTAFLPSSVVSELPRLASKFLVSQGANLLKTAEE